MEPFNGQKRNLSSKYVWRSLHNALPTVLGHICTILPGRVAAKKLQGAILYPTIDSHEGQEGRDHLLDLLLEVQITQDSSL